MTLQTVRGRGVSLQRFLLALFCLWIGGLLVSGSRAEVVAFNVSEKGRRQTPQQTEIELKALVEKYYAAHQQKDTAKLAAFWVSSSPHLAAARLEWEARLTETAGIEVKQLVIRDIRINDAQARLRLKMEMPAVTQQNNSPGNWESLNLVFYCRREDGQWKVWQVIGGETELAKNLMAAKTESERQSLLAAETEPDNKRLAQELLDATGKQIAQKLPLKPTDEDSVLALCLLTERIAENTADPNLKVRAIAQVALRHHHRNEYRQALIQNLKGLPVAEKSGNKAGLAKHLDAVAFNHMNLGELRAAISYYERSLQLWEELGDKSGIAGTSYALGIAYREKGEHDRALVKGLRALRLYEELEQKANIAKAINTLGNLYFAQDNQPQALSHFMQSLKLQEELGAKAGIAVALNNIANAYSVQKDYRKAVEYYSRSLALAEEAGAKNRIAGTLYNLGNSYRDEGNYALALDYNRRALKLAVELGIKTMISGITYSLGKTYYLQGDYLKAIPLCEQARDMAQEQEYLQIHWMSLRTLALSQQALSQPEAARRTLEAAIETIEKYHSRAAGGVTERQKFFEHLASAYQAMVSLLLDQKQPESAHAYAQRMKGRVLLETLQTGPRDPQLLSDAQQEHKKTLENHLAELNRQLLLARSQSATSAGRMDQLTEDLAEARLKYEAYLNELIAAHPEWKSQTGNLSPLTPTEAARLIPDRKTAVLDFVVGTEKTILFVLSRENDEPTTRLTHYELDIPRQELESRVRRFRQLLADRDLNFRLPAGELFNLLLQPAAGQLRGKTSLVIIPDGLLWEVPFQTLLNPEGRFLIQDVTVSYAPSLPALNKMAQTKQQRSVQTGSKKLLALGPSGEPGIAQSTGLLSTKTASLPGVGNYVLKLPGAKAYTGTKASEEAFKSEASDYRVLHFATHGQLDENFPMYSALQLAPNEKEDGQLEAREILNLNLKADLAILAACETARGRIGNGEGMIGLSWSFLIAGCPTVVSSLWKVESSSTTELMLELHRQLNLPACPSPAEALRQAALKLLKEKEYRHPFYWSGFVTIGAPR